MYSIQWMDIGGYLVYLMGSTACLSYARDLSVGRSERRSMASHRALRPPSAWGFNPISRHPYSIRKACEENRRWDPEACILPNGVRTDNRPEVGYLQLYQALNQDTRTAQTMPWSSDISWEK